MTAIERDIVETAQVQSDQVVNVVTAIRAQLDTFVFTGQTDANGSFSIPHGFAPPHITPFAGNRIRAISVIVQHQNGNWHTLEQSNAVDNRFWIAPTAVQGRVASPLFANRPVQVVIFTQYIVG
jgi:hypothetical protein